MVLLANQVLNLLLYYSVTLILYVYPNILLYYSATLRYVYTNYYSVSSPRGDFDEMRELVTPLYQLSPPTDPAR